jgi:hypothetical protein
MHARAYLLLLDSVLNFLLATVSPDIFQVCCHTWNTSLNQRELKEHLRIAYNKDAEGRMVFQAAEAETTRTFLKSILDGKGIPARCTRRPLPSSSAAAAGLEPTLQTLPNACSLFLGAASRAKPLWFHPSLADAEQLSMGIESNAAAAGPQFAASSNPHDSAASSDIAMAASKLPRFALASHAAVISPLLGLAAAAQSDLHTSNAASSGELSAVSSRRQNKKKRKIANLFPSHACRSADVQFVSIRQPATLCTPAIPSVLICNTPRPSAADAAGAQAGAAANPSPQPRRRQRK